MAMNFKNVHVLILVLVGSAHIKSLSSPSLNSVQLCYKGPSNWCESIINAKKCNAVRHCIQTVWEKQDVPEDNDSICRICLDMVDQAREQLESNETQSDLREVFEGSCRLIILKPIVKECVKLVDDFIPELVEALSSQMNPQVVCSTAGLCNNANIDKMLIEYDSLIKSQVLVSAPGPKRLKQRLLSCDECGYVASIISIKFKITGRDELLESMLILCGHVSSFSDACANISLKYFRTFYNFISRNIDSDGICHLSGACVTKYHHHSNSIEITKKSNMGQDIPCELCQQLIHHLQEVLTANTTEIEFKMVLEGLCKETGNFKTECTSIVDQYYEQIYNTIVKNFDANGACFLIGICPKGRPESFLGQNNIVPLISYIKPAMAEIKLTKLNQSSVNVYTNKTETEIGSMLLSLDWLMVPRVPESMVDNGQLCTFCEYFMHFLQESLASPSTEKKIKDAFSQVCDKFSATLRGNCHNFVEMYGDAVIALMIQGFDPRAVCPKMNMCPKDENEFLTIKKVKYAQSEKPMCPLCLFAVQQAQEVIRDNKSKENIKIVLESLCSRLHKKLKSECVDFVQTYSNELIDMLMTDFSPQQICVYISLCNSSFSDRLDLVNLDLDNELELYDETEKQDASDLKNYELEKNILPECLLCERVISEAEKRIGPVKTKEEIENALYHACDKLHKLKDKCHQYIDKFGDKIADLILQEIKPKQICKEMGYCSWILLFDKITDRNEKETKLLSTHAVNNAKTMNSSPCILCEFIIAKLENELKSKKTQEEIKHEVESICKKMPKTISNSCDKLIEKYENIIVVLLETVPLKTVCENLKLCQVDESQMNDQVVECGVCFGAASTLVPYINGNTKKVFKTDDLVEVACETLPAKYFKKCSKLLEYYGESIINMIRRETQLPEICPKIGKCFEEEIPNLTFFKIKDNVIQVDRKDKLFGSEKCTLGPGYWCSTKENAISCNATQYCEKNVWLTNKASILSH